MALTVPPRRTLAPEQLPAVMTEDEVAAYLSVPVSKLRRLSYERRGPKVRKIAGQRRIRREDLIDWLAERFS